MANWKVTPSNGVTGSNGTFNFSENTSSNDIDYTISYTGDNGCTATTVYMVPACPACEYEVSVSTALCDDSTGNSHLTFNTVKIVAVSVIGVIL